MVSKKHLKEMASLKKRLGKHLPWFDSLSDKSRWDIFFTLKHEKYFWKHYNIRFSERKFPFNKRIYKFKKMYKVPIFRLRNATLERLLKLNTYK